MYQYSYVIDNPGTITALASTRYNILRSEVMSYINLYLIHTGISSVSLIAFVALASGLINMHSYITNIALRQ